jgi:hypothetical protein
MPMKIGSVVKVTKTADYGRTPNLNPTSAPAWQLDEYKMNTL